MDGLYWLHPALLLPFAAGMSPVQVGPLKQRVGVFLMEEIWFGLCKSRRICFIFQALFSDSSCRKHDLNVPQEEFMTWELFGVL